MYSAVRHNTLAAEVCSRAVHRTFLQHRGRSKHCVFLLGVQSSCTYNSTYITIISRRRLLKNCKLAIFQVLRAWARAHTWPTLFCTYGVNCHGPPEPTHHHQHDSPVCLLSLSRSCCPPRLPLLLHHTRTRRLCTALAPSQPPPLPSFCRCSRFAVVMRVVGRARLGHV